MEKIVIEGHEFEGYSIPMENNILLVIKAERGYLACGYISIDTSNKLLEHTALVKGVKNYDDMLEAEVFAVSDAASAIGIKHGMSGRDALLKMV